MYAQSYRQVAISLHIHHVIHTVAVLALQMTDVYAPILAGLTVHFAQPDVLKVSFFARALLTLANYLNNSFRAPWFKF